MQTKKIKVLYSSRQSGSRTYFGGSTYSQIPKIQMEGKWLEALGFHIGDALQVDYDDGEIRIRLAPSEQPAMMVCEESGSYAKGKSQSNKRKKATC
ncbi:MAG: SymE family type I addiction module toxin [Hespellia sp.]|nr:SymE family type I addiction module toxin [Hespellia sp.]